MASIAISAAARGHAETDGVRAILRLEGFALLSGAVAFYAHQSSSWSLFAALFLVPDLSFTFYLFGPRFGATAYNAMHSTLGPIVLAAWGFLFAQSVALSIAAIWLAHVGFDRALGYGLKYADAFAHTHLGWIGKRANSE
jgi:hypothetical protein